MRLITVVVALAATAVMTTGSASGADGPLRPDDRAGTRGPGTLTGSSVALVHPDDRAGAKGPGATDSTPSTYVRPDDRAGPRGPGALVLANPASNVKIVRVSSDGFDWPAAFVGAASSLGLCLLFGAALVLRPRGRTTATS